MKNLLLLTGLFLLFSGTAIFADDSEFPTRFDPLIKKIAGENGIHPLFVKALIWRESKYDPCATGKAGEIGLMQVKMSVVKDWSKAQNRAIPSKTQVYDPYLNLQIGIWCLARALRHWEGNPEQMNLALCEYNGGRRALLRWIVHYDGDYSRVVNNCKSANYARAIVAKFSELSTAGSNRLLLAATNE